MPNQALVVAKETGYGLFNPTLHRRTIGISEGKDSAPKALVHPNADAKMRSDTESSEPEIGPVPISASANALGIL